MFMFDLVFVIELIALGFGIIFIIWADRNEGAGTILARISGYIITIASVVTILCTLYYGTTYWIKGYFRLPMPYMSSMSMMNNNMMMRNQKMMMRNHPMMQYNQKSMQTK